MKQKLLKVLLMCGLLLFLIPFRAEAAGTNPYNATTILSGDTVQGTLTYSADSHWYRINLEKPGRLTLNSENFGTGYLYTYLYNSEQTSTYDYIASDSCSSYGSTSFNVDLLAGTYYIRMHQYVSSGSSAKYTLTAKITYAGQTFAEKKANSDGTMAKAHVIKFGATYKGQTALNDECDYFKISVPSYSVIRVAVTGDKNNEFEFYNAGGTEFSYKNRVGADENKRTYIFALKKGTYYFKVSRVYKTTTGPYTFKMGRTNVGFNKTSKGYYYQNEYGTKLNKWQTIGKYRYYFANYYRVTGWKQISGYWYYFDKNGRMATKWTQIGKNWYYFNDAMYTGYRSIGGKWYLFSAKGVMTKGWGKVGSSWHYFGTDGVEKYGWQKIGGYWYYFSKSGYMYHGTYYYINGKKYWFNDNGVCQNP